MEKDNDAFFGGESSGTWHSGSDDSNNNEAQKTCSIYSNSNEMSVIDWIITLIVISIPCINVIMMFVWGFGGNGNENRSNYCKAGLILMAIIIVFYLMFTLLGIFAGFKMLELLL